MKLPEANIKFLNELLADLAMKDFLAVNKKLKIDKKTGCPIYKPYSLSMETEEVRRLHNLSLRDDLSKEQVEEIKAFILKRKLIY